MRIRVRVVPRAKQQGIERQADGSLRVRVAAPPQDGRANEALIAALAGHFGVPLRAVRIVRGHSSRAKLIEIAP